MPETPVDEGKSEAEVIPEVDAQGKHPDSIPWSQYVGVKQSLGKKLDTATSKLTSLEEQLKTAVKPEDHAKVVAELTATKAEKEKAAAELKAIREASTSEKRSILQNKGVPESEVKAMSEDALNGAIKVLGYATKPGSDMGSGGGGSGSLHGTPQELAMQAYSKSK